MKVCEFLFGTDESLYIQCFLVISIRSDQGGSWNLFSWNLTMQINYLMLLLFLTISNNLVLTKVQNIEVTMLYIPNKYPKRNREKHNLQYLQMFLNKDFIIFIFTRFCCVPVKFVSGYTVLSWNILKEKTKLTSFHKSIQKYVINTNYPNTRWSHFSHVLQSRVSIFVQLDLSWKLK